MENSLHHVEMVSTCIALLLPHAWIALILVLIFEPTWLKILIIDSLSTRLYEYNHYVQVPQLHLIKLESHQCVLLAFLSNLLTILKFLMVLS